MATAERGGRFNMAVDTGNMRKPLTYAVAGAGVALVAAMVVPASVLVGLGAATAGGLCLYKALKGDVAGAGCGTEGKKKKEEDGYVDV